MVDLSKYTSTFSGSVFSSEDTISNNDSHIEFVCEKELFGAIPEPKPATKVLPDWYKELEPNIDNTDDELSTSTVKKCAPFLDALTLGWIIPLCGEVEFYYDESTGEYESNQNFKKKLMEDHNPDQVSGHPLGDQPIIKFLNYWAIKVPDGYSVLFTSPFNRVEPRFEPFSGVVDADNYFNLVNFPAVWTGGSYHGVLDIGTPIVQAIPIKRDELVGDATIREMTDEESMESQKDSHSVAAKESYYREDIWTPKGGSRVVDRDEPSHSQSETKDEDDGDSKCPFH